MRRTLVTLTIMGALTLTPPFASTACAQDGTVTGPVAAQGQVEEAVTDDSSDDYGDWGLLGLLGLFGLFGYKKYKEYRATRATDTTDPDGIGGTSRRV